MKLHLGCGERYLNGYINIDFPIKEHPIQDKSVADEHANILTLNYSPETIDEVRLHHVFEHFSRPIACALVVSWYSWLKPNGIIHIEVPDLFKMIILIVNPISSYKTKSKAIRHIFGSHEADWAIHFEGYTSKSLSKLLSMYGFKILKINRLHWKNTYNIEVIAQKNIEYQKNDFENLTKSYLSNFLIDNSDSELKLLETWICLYNRQLEIGWAK